MLSFKPFDVTAPRFKATKKNAITSSLLQEFRVKYPQYTEKSNEELINIIKQFHDNIWKTIISNRDGVELQAGLGFIFIGSYKSKRKFLDNKKSAELGKRVTHQNWDTDGFSAKIFYSNYATKYKLRNRDLWKFSAVRQFKRTVSATYPGNWKYYITVDDFFKISSLFKKITYKHNMLKEAANHMDSYNEFKLD